MNVFGHDDVTQQSEVVAVTDLAQKLQEQVAAPLGGEERQAAITAAGDEVQVSEAVAAFRFILARRHAPLCPKGVRHPQNFDAEAYAKCCVWPTRAA